MKKYLKVLIFIFGPIFMLSKYSNSERILDVHDWELKNEELVYKAGEILPFTGKLILKYENGNLEREDSIVNGIFHGEFKVYYENGKIAQEGYNKDNKLHGIIKNYDENGKLLFISEYKDGEEILAMEQKIGSKDFGYIFLPKRFKKFYDGTRIPTGDIQYSDGITIFTLNIFQDKTHTLETAANSVFSNLVNRGVRNVQGATIEFVDKYKCFQIYGEYNNSQNIIVAYVFKANKNIQVLIFEGAKEQLEENLEIAETYRVKL